MEELMLRNDGSLRRSFPKRVGWLGYWFLVYSSRAHWVFSCRLSMYWGSVRPDASVKTKLHFVTLLRMRSIVSRSVTRRRGRTHTLDFTFALLLISHTDKMPSMLTEIYQSNNKTFYIRQALIVSRFKKVLWTGLPDVNNTIALRQANSAASTCRFRYFSICSWNILTLSINVTILSGDMWFEWIPADARSGATCRGIGHWAALSTNNSLQTNRSSATWSVTARSGKNGMLRAHSTALNNNRAANSQMFSIPIIPHGMFIPCWNLVVGYGSARSKRLIKPDRNEWPFETSLPFNAECWGLGCGTCVGGIRPLWTAVGKGEKVHSTYYSCTCNEYLLFISGQSEPNGFVIC